MSNGNRRGLWIGVLAVVALVAGLGIWRMRSRPAGEGVGAGRGGASGPRLVTGRGTTWMDDDGKAEASGAIEGVVLDGDGKPVDGARVTLGRARGRNEDGFNMSFLQPKGTATSAGGGRFRIDSLLPGDYAATAILDGATPGTRNGIEVKAKETARIELKLGKGGFLLSGRVIDVGGGVVTGARVTVIPRNMGAGGGGRGPLLLPVVTGADGQYKITVARGNYGLRGEADGYAPRQDEIFVARATTKDLKLVPAARLTGRVIERASKQPVADAEVSLTSASRMDFKPPQEAKSDASGKFEFTGLEPGAYEVMARKGMLIGVGKGVGLAPAQSVENVEVPLDRGFVVSGTVKDEEGKGLDNMRIWAGRDSPPFGQAARTRSNPDGTYALEGLLPGNYRLNVSEEGMGYGNARARVVEKDVRNVDIVLPRTVKVTGKVLTADGQPVEAARVQAMIEIRQAGNMMTTGDFATTAADGSFELKRVSPSSLRITVRHEDHGIESFGPEDVKAGEKKVLALVLKKGGVITGLVRSDDGKPAPDVRVLAFARDQRMFMDAQDVSGPDGRYRIGGLPAGKIQVSASRTGRPMFGGMDQGENQKTVSLGAGEEKGGVDLVVGGPTLAIKGIAVATDGKPVPGAIVTGAVERDGRAFRGSSRDLKAYSDLDGQFVLDNLEKGNYTLWASHPDLPEAELKNVVSNATGVKVTFPPDTIATGVVVTPDGKPVPFYSITVLPGPTPNEKPEERRRRQNQGSFESRIERVQSPDGSFELRRLGPGSYELVINAAGGASASETFSVQAGERKTGLRIQVQPGVRVVGSVVDHATGKPIPGASVSAMGRGAERITADVNPDGTFALEGGTTGEMIRIFAQADPTQYVSEFKEVPIKAGEATIDAGTLRLYPGNQRDRMMGDFSERGQIGANVAVNDGKAMLRSVQPEGPAAKAGLKKNDLVTAISTPSGTNVATNGLGNGALNFLVTGKPGEKVNLTVESPGAAPRTVEVTRETFKPPTPRN